VQVANDRRSGPRIIIVSGTGIGGDEHEHAERDQQAWQSELS